MDVINVDRLLLHVPTWCPRRVDDDLSELVRSIADNCILVPLVVRRANNEIVAGVRRFWVAYSLGIRKVPVRYINCTDLEARQAFVFSRNR